MLFRYSIINLVIFLFKERFLSAMLYLGFACITSAENWNLLHVSNLIGVGIGRT